MKKLLLYFLFLSSTALAQSPFYNDEVRSNTLSPARVASALDVSKVLSSSGTNTYTFSVPFTGFTYHTGDIYTFVFVNANSSGTVTAQIGALSALAIKDAEGNNLAVGALKAGGAYKFYYNGTHLRLIGGSTSTGGGGASAAGTTGNLQYKSAGGGLQAEAALTYDSATNTQSVDNIKLTTVQDLDTLTHFVARRVSDGKLFYRRLSSITVPIGNVSGLGTGIATALGVNVGSAGAPVLFNGALGTPSSGTLTNATGLPVSTGISGLGTGVATALAANTNTSNGITTPNGTATLTNKRFTPRVQSVSSSATVTPNADDDDAVKITAQAAGLTLANPSGTPVTMQAMVIRIKDNGTARSITYGSQYRAIGVVLPTTTVISKTLYLGMIWNDADTKWDVIGYSLEP